MTIRAISRFLLVAVAALAATMALAQTARFARPLESAVVSADGTLDLAWEPTGSIERGPDVVYEARRWTADAAADDPGILAYRGEDTSSFVSGLQEGTYVFKIRAREPNGEFAPWPEASSLEVKVVFHSQAKVMTMLIAGAATLAITVCSIVVGHRRTRTA